MKKFLPFCFLVFPFFVAAQAPDSAAVAQEVDSLLKLSLELRNERNFEKALFINAKAEEKAIATFGKKDTIYANILNNFGIIYYFKRDYKKAEAYYTKSKELRASVLGKEHPDYARSLNNLAILYKVIGDHKNAESLYLEAKKIRRKVLGTEHADYTGSLNNLIDLYKTIREYEKVETLYQELLEITERTIGKNDPDYCRTLINMGNFYFGINAYDKTESFYLEAKNIFEDSLKNREHTSYTNVLYNLGLLYWQTGQYKKAEPFYLEAMAIREKTLGKKHIQYCANVINLGILYSSMGNYVKAEPLYLEAKSIFEDSLKNLTHPYYENCLNSLADLYRKIGAYGKAEPLFQKVLAIVAKSSGKTHHRYADVLNNLAVLYRAKGDYERAETLYLEALDIFKNTLGKEHLGYADYLNNLGNLYMLMGNYENGERLLLEALAITERKLGKEHPDYVTTLYNLAVLYTEMGEYEKAEPLNLEALAAREKILGKEHPNYLTSLHNLANLYRNTDKYEEAEKLFIESLSITEKTLGKANPYYCGNLIDLASLYMQMSEYKKAELNYLEAKNIFENTLDNRGHPFYLNCLNNMTILYRKMNRYEEIIPIVLNANEIEKYFWLKASRHLSEKELTAYKKTFKHKQDKNFSFIFLQKGLTGIGYDNILFYKGFLLNAAKKINKLAQTDSTSIVIYERLKSCHRLLAVERSKSSVDQESLKELEIQTNDLEKELVRTVAGFGEALRQATWQEVKQQLNPGEAALEFVHYQFHDPNHTDSTMYAALLLRPGDEEPFFIPLFEEKQLTKILASEKETARNELLAQAYTRGVVPVGEKNLAGLYELIWQPLDSLMENVTTVHYSPSGLLHRINLDAIPINKTQRLADQYSLQRLGSTRSLVVPDIRTAESGQTAALFGGVQYEIDTSGIKQDTLDTIISAANSELSFRYGDRSAPQRGENWDYLPGTAVEVANVKTLLQQSGYSTRVFQGEAADETTFKNIGQEGPSPRILHLATHGFFFPDPEEKGDRSVGMDAEPVFKISDHPMIRSGLILAGGNHAWQTGIPPKAGMEDGILTAYEISQMDLSGTELVVLSACETGLGDIKGNEGVYGLQRAFKIAGVKNMIMSFWQVPDRQTQELMTAFYRQWLQEDKTIREAFYGAQREMRERYDDPFVWAAFVLVE